MSQEIPDGEFKWVSEDECRDMKLLLNYADGRIAMDYLIIEKTRRTKKSFIFEVDMEHLPELHERDDDYPLALEVMTIEPEINGDKQHNLRAQYFGVSCPYSRKLICSFLPKNHYVVLGQLLRFYLDRGKRLIKVHRAIRSKSLPMSQAT